MKTTADEYSNISKVITKLSIDSINSFQESIKSERKLSVFEIDCKDLDSHFLTNNICISKEFKAIFNELNLITNPVLYWFEIVSDIKPEQIIDSISKYKSIVGDRKRAVPAWNKIFDRNSRILYLGKVKGSFSGRLVTHFGYAGSHQTQGLQLDVWAKDLSLKLKLYVLEFDKNMAELMGVIESAAARELKPIIGKHK